MPVGHQDRTGGRERSVTGRPGSLRARELLAHPPQVRCPAGLMATSSTAVPVSALGQGESSVAVQVGQRSGRPRPAGCSGFRSRVWSKVPSLVLVYRGSWDSRRGARPLRELGLSQQAERSGGEEIRWA